VSRVIFILSYSKNKKLILNIVKRPTGTGKSQNIYNLLIKGLTEEY